MRFYFLMLWSCLLAGMMPVFTEAQTSQPINFIGYAPLPNHELNAAYASDRQHLYSLSGQELNGQVSSKVYRYTAATNTWDVLTDKLVPKTQSSAVYVPSVHKIYIMGGQKAFKTGFFYEVEAVDTQTGAVELLKVSNPISGLHLGLTAWGDKIYLFGGNEGGKGISKMYAFDIHTLEFTKLKNIPNGGEVQGIATDGKIYTFGGYDPLVFYFYKDINVYDMQSNTWQQIGKLPQRVSATSLALFGRYIFLNGSYPKNGFAGYFDTDTKRFTPLKSNAIGRYFGGAGVIDNKLYVYGGYNSRIDAGQIVLQAADILPVLNAVNP